MPPPPRAWLPLTSCVRLTTTVLCQCALRIPPAPPTAARWYGTPSPRAGKLWPRQQSVQPRLSKEEALRRYSAKDFPVGSFMSAWKAQAVPFTPTTALDIIRRYAELRGDIDPNSKAEAEHGKVLCEEFNICPNTLTLIGLTLHKSTSSSSHLRATSIHLLTLAHELKDPHATILLYNRALNSVVPPDHEPFRRASREAMIRRYLNRIEHYAKSSRDPVSMYIWGEYLTKNNIFRQMEAKEWLRAAGEKGVAKAWCLLGATLLQELKAVMGGISSSPGHLRTRETTKEKANALFQEAHTVFIAACEADVPEAYNALAWLLTVPSEGMSEAAVGIDNEADNKSESYSPVPPKSNPIPAHLPPPQPPFEAVYVELLLRAASSGIEAAMFGLGVYYAHHASPPDQVLAHEWVKAAAFAGNPGAMAAYRDILLSEGKVDLAKEWDVAAEWREVVRRKNTRN